MLTYAGKEPFWTLRVFSTLETSEELIRPNVDKYDKMDAFLAGVRLHACTHADVC